MQRNTTWLIFGLGLANLAAVLGVFAQDRPPVARFRSNPIYPYEMARQGIGGAVLVEFIISYEGDVLDARVIKSTDRAFELPALQAVAEWRFRPGEKNGRKVNVRVSQLLVFNIDATPVYPFALLQDEIGGTATVEYAVDAKGRATRISVIEATRPEFGQAVQAMVAARTYPPAFKEDSHNVAPRRITQKFVIDGRSDAPVSESAHKILGALRQHKTFPLAAELDTPLVPKVRPSPIFPAGINPDILPVTALVEFFVDEDGAVQLPRIVSAPQEEFGYAAVQAIANWRYEPPRKNKKATVVRAQIPIEFKLPTDASR